MGISFPFLCLSLALLLVPTFGDEAYLLQLSSLLPSFSCTRSPIGGEDNGALLLELVDKYGPCSNMGLSLITTAQRLQLDRARARSIQSALAASATASIPIKDGAIAAAGDFVVKVGLGTPRKDISLVVDTGSASTWTQCKKGAVFDPFFSTTYANVSCERSACSVFARLPGAEGSCEVASCTYAINYGHNSLSKGFLAHDKLTIGSDSFQEFYFGCAQSDKGNFAGASGVLGFGRDAFSVPEQTEEKYGRYFSYCLPSKPSYVGKLTMGKGGASKSVKYTPLVKNSTHRSLDIPTHPSLYIVEVIAISVGGVKLGIPPKVLSAPGTVIDSGTAISRLPSTVYTKLTAVFGHAMAKYPRAKPLSILEHCYNLKGYKNVRVPKISFFFKGGVEVPLHSSGILIGNGLGRMCLAFAASEAESDVSIFGNVQQRTLNVVFNTKGGKIGFGVNGCH